MSGLSNIMKQPTKWAREDGQAKAMAAIHAIIISFVAIGFFSIMMLVWFKVYRYSFLWSILIAVLCLIAVIVISVVGLKRKNERMWVVFMGALSGVMIVTGIVFGFFMYYRHLVYYLRYQEMRTYSNVGGSQPATSFNDGSMFLFTQDTRLDVMRSVGFKSRWTGETYCVAPVVDSTMTAANAINFWSIGENCCLARGDFVCGDAEDPKTMSALVVLEPEDVVRPFMKWAVAGASYPRYIRSIHLQEAAYATRAAQNIKLLYWVKDPIAKMNSFYDEAKDTTVWTGVCLWIAILFVSYFLCYTYRYVKPRADKRLAAAANTPLTQKPQTA